MTEPTTTSRRRVLSMLLGAASFGIFGLSGLRLPTVWFSSRVIPGGAGQGPSRSAASAIALGAVFVAHRPEEADPIILRDRLGLPRGSVEDLACSLRARLSVARRDDFRIGRVYEIDGWTLSETELRLFALLYLERRPSERGRRRAPGRGARAGRGSA